MNFSGIDREAENGLGDAQNRGAASGNVNRVTKRNPIKKTKMTAIKVYCKATSNHTNDDGRNLKEEANEKTETKNK